MNKKPVITTFTALFIVWASSLKAHTLKHINHDIRESFLETQVLDSLRQDTLPLKESNANKSQLKGALRHSDAYLFLDRDNDGTNDKFDKDIDGDGVLNLLDKQPFNKEKGQEDRDNDGLYDFIDANPDGMAKTEYGRAQEIIYNKTGIILFASEVKFSQKNLRIIKESLTEGIFQHLNFSQSLNVIVLRPEKDRTNLNKASYNPYWNTINIYKIEKLSSPKKFQETFLHEMGHVFAKIAHEDKSQILHKAKDLAHFAPSEYAKTNEEEWFAESFVSTLYLIGEIDTIDRTRYNNLKYFDGSYAYYAIKDMWLRRKGKEVNSPPFR